MKQAKRILYVQYTNPGAYPPLEHSSRILADAGWRVRFLGTGAQGAAGELAFPAHPNVSLRLWRFQPPGWRQKLQYLSFIVWCMAACLTWRPTVIYCSDPWSAPIGVVLWYLLRVPVVYHEHDAPGRPANSIVRFVHAMRRRLARVAVACVVPQQERLRQFEAELRPRRAFCVWNCPRRDEVRLSERDRTSDGLNLFYVGSLNRSRLPEAAVYALSELSDDVKLHVVGYETAGEPGYSERLKQIAADQGVATRLRLYGASRRERFFRVGADCDVGLCLMPTQSSDANLQAMFGASNKLFDYLACGLAVVVPDQGEWTSHVVQRGYGVACDVNRPETFAALFKELDEKRAQWRRMGEMGRQRILADWNYETQFEPVRLLLERLSA